MALIRLLSLLAKLLHSSTTGMGALQATSDTGGPRLGCKACFDADAPSAWQNVRRLKRVAVLVDESHYVIRIMACPRCAQQAVAIFTELTMVADYDPQYWSVLPLRPEEADELSAQGADIDTHRIEAIGSARRYLQADLLGDGSERIRWAEGHLVIGPHD